MSFTLFVTPLTDLAYASALSLARAQNHHLYVYPREQDDALKFEMLRKAGVQICDASTFFPEPVRYSHPRWGGYAPFADAFRYHVLRRSQESLWVDSDSFLVAGRNIPLHDFVASEHVKYTFPARTKGLFDADSRAFYSRAEPVKDWFQACASPALVTNSHMRLRGGYLLNELARRFTVDQIPKLKSGNGGMAVLQELVREQDREVLLAHPNVFNPVAAYDIARFERVMEGGEELPMECAVLHIFRVAREKSDAGRLANFAARVARFGTAHALRGRGERG